MNKQINVVGAALIQNNQILATKRNDDRKLGSLWEFPGGKIQPGETPQEALKRELSEEFNDTILVGDRVTDTSSHEYDFGTVNLTVYYAKFLTHHFNLIAHSEVDWVSPELLDQLTWADADVLAVEAIKHADLAEVIANGFK